MAGALLDGRFDDSVFAPERLQDPGIRALMDKITVTEDKELTRRASEGKLPCRIDILSKSGVRKTAATDYPRGYYRNPMSDGEIEEKFRTHARRVLPDERIDSALRTIWEIDRAPNLDGLFAAARSDS